MRSWRARSPWPARTQPQAGSVQLQFSWQLSSAGYPRPENQPDSRPAPQANLEGRDPAGQLAIWQGTLEAEKHQKEALRPAVASRPEPPRKPCTRVWCPAALPEGIEAETGDEVRAGFHAVAASPYAAHQTRTDVDASRDADTETGFHAAAASENSVHPNFALYGLRWDLREGGFSPENQENERKRFDREHLAAPRR
jgi:hypothetical protein